MASDTTVLAWHFVGNALRDGRPIPPDGEKLVHDGSLTLCESGLHASVDLLDALRYAPGETLCRVECSGETLLETDKLCCRERTILWRIDAGPVLRAFARWCALQVIGKWEAPDAVVDFLKTGDLAKRAAAWNAAWDAAWTTAEPAAWAARDAARDAAEPARGAATDVAWSAARATAQAAERDAAWDAAWDAAKSAQSKQLTAMVEEARGGRTEWVF